MKLGANSYVISLTRTYVSLLALALLVGACSSNSDGSPQPLAGTVTIAPAVAWAGSTVLVSAGELRGHSNTAVLRLGTDSVIATRTNDTTFSASLPATMGGSAQFMFELDGYQVPASSLTVYGYSRVQTLPLSPGEAYNWPRAGSGMLLASATVCSPNCADGLALFDLDANSVTSLGGIGNWQCLHGPGSSYLDSVVVVCDSASNVETWRLLPTPSRVASYPGVTSDWEAIQLGASQWLLGHKQAFATPAASIGTYQPQGVHMSPRHDRAAMRILRTTPTPGPVTGVPVFAAPSGDVAYYVTRLGAAEGIDFSADGELLAMAGGVTDWVSDSDRVLLLNASTGAVLHDTTVYQRHVFAVAIDPYRPYLYVGMATTDGPTILVLDRDTFSAVAELRPPAAASSANCCNFGVITLNAHDALYVYGGNSLQTIWRFSLPAVTPLRRP
jgi:hypothetical protein